MIKYIPLILSIFLIACIKNPKANYKTENIQAIAQNVKAKDIIIYTTPDCIYCNKAKNWLKQNNFAFTDCNMDVSKQCEQQYNTYGGNGVPLLVINHNGKQHIMHDGFDTDELLIALTE